MSQPSDKPLDLASLCAGFRAVEPRVDLWRRWPDVTEEEDALSDEWACDDVSTAFAEFVRSYGIAADVVRCDNAENPMADYHVWVRVQLENGQRWYVDWTARQYYNLDDTAADALDAPWPLVWAAAGHAGTHPIAGLFRVVTIGQPV